MKHIRAYYYCYYCFVLARSRVERDTQIILPSLENYLHIELLI